MFQGKELHKCKEEDIIRYLLEAGKAIIEKDMKIQEEEEKLQNVWKKRLWLMFYANKLSNYQLLLIFSISSSNLFL